MLAVTVAPDQAARDRGGATMAGFIHSTDATVSILIFNYSGSAKIRFVDVRSRKSPVICDRPFVRFGESAE